MDQATKYDEPRHPIRVVAQRTGLTPATLRAWERRYGAVEPGRSDGGQRLYSDADVDRLTGLRELTEAGRPISMVAELSRDEALQLLTEDRASAPEPDAPAGPPASTDDAMARVRAMDAEGLEDVLRRSAATLGAIPFLESVVAPLFHRIGDDWAAGDLGPAEEHLATAVMERVLSWLTGPGPLPGEAPSIVVATLPGERHGLGARLVAVTAGLAGWRVLSLGVELPAEDIVDAALRTGASVVALSMVHPDVAERSRSALGAVRTGLPNRVRVLAGGSAVSQVGERGLPAGVEAIRGLADLRSLLDGERRGARRTDRTDPP